MKYIYGPVKSRRLGLSLGVSLSSYKICNYDCIYCQLGRTAEPKAKKAGYARPEEIIEEIQTWLNNNPKEAKDLNYITFSGRGEPTLDNSIGKLILQLKKISNIPIAVITNASLLSDPHMRADLSGVNLIVPSLDAISFDIFKKLNRPHGNLKIENIIDGLVKLRKEFKGKIWLEVMIVKGVNDKLPYIKKMKEVIGRINPDKIQLNSPVRAPMGAGVSVITKNKLEKIKGILGDRCEII